MAASMPTIYVALRRVLRRLRSARAPDRRVRASTHPQVRCTRGVSAVFALTAPVWRRGNVDTTADVKRMFGFGVPRFISDHAAPTLGRDGASNHGRHDTSPRAFRPRLDRVPAVVCFQAAHIPCEQPNTHDRSEGCPTIAESTPQASEQPLNRTSSEPFVPDKPTPVGTAYAGRIRTRVTAKRWAT